MSHVELACNREDLDHAERTRHAELLEVLRESRRSTRELLNGYVSTFPSRPDVLGHLSEWIGLELAAAPSSRSRSPSIAPQSL